MSDLKTRLQQLIQTSEESHENNFEQFGAIIHNLLKGNDPEELHEQLDDLIQNNDEEIQQLCYYYHREFIQTVEKLLKVRESSGVLTRLLEEFNGQIQLFGNQLYDQKSEYLKLKKSRINIQKTIEILQSCLHVSKLALQMQTQVNSRNFFSALKLLEELRIVQIPKLKQFAFIEYMESCIPLMEKELRESVSTDLKDWLFNIRASSKSAGKECYFRMELKLKTWRKRLDANDKLRPVIHEVEDENREDDRDIVIDIKPLYQSIHILDKLNSLEDFKIAFQDDRRAQIELILSSNIAFEETTQQSFQNLLFELLGFFTLENQILNTTQGFRSKFEIGSLWEKVVEYISNLLAHNMHHIRVDQQSSQKCKHMLEVFLYAMENNSFSVRKLQELFFAMFGK